MFETNGKIVSKKFKAIFKYFDIETNNVGLIIGIMQSRSVGGFIK